jgi:hypothetical protein
MRLLATGRKDITFLQLDQRRSLFYRTDLHSPMSDGYLQIVIKIETGILFLHNHYDCQISPSAVKKVPLKIDLFNKAGYDSLGTALLCQFGITSEHSRSVRLFGRHYL